jgi:hypothetical protein
MRHIPEEELHAYLDQALSRTQCVEIESHLAACAGCSEARDGIAALRDRTTALLASLAPPRGFPPILDNLRAEAAARTARRHQTRRAAVWAASVAAALALGWGANTYFSAPKPRVLAPSTVADAGTDRPTETPIVSPTAGPAAQPAPSEQVPLHRTSVPESSRAHRPEPAPTFSIGEPPRAEVSSATLPTGEADAGLGGIWRTLSWAGARDERGDSVPHIDGLPVVEVQVGPAKTGGNKSIMVVAQQLKSGEVIRTIEGPAADVSQLLANRAGATSPSPWPTMDGPGIAGGDGAMAMRHGDRMLAITAQLPNDSLRAMMRRLNAEMRQK